MSEAMKLDPETALRTVVLARGNGWQALYVDGSLTCEDDRIRAKWVKEAVDNAAPCVYMVRDTDIDGDFPESIEEITTWNP